MRFEMYWNVYRESTGEQMKQFRKKPVVVDAMQFVAGQLESAAKWSGGILVVENNQKIVGLSIATLEGRMTANLGDWIIKGVKGEFYPCKPDIFEQTYEEVKP
jgi:hypothetical protein